jgi:hypothetical protein
LTGKKKVKKKRKVNWREYNESLVRRGEVMFDTAFLGNWRAAELRAAMNEGKEVAKYVYPSSLIWFCSPSYTHIPTASVQAAGRLPESDVQTHKETESTGLHNNDALESGTGKGTAAGSRGRPKKKVS